MTIRVMVCCDGTPDDRPTMALEQCRAFFPSRWHFVGGARREATGAGWQCDLFGRDLCPACVRARNRCAHTSSMRHGDRRVCADCGDTP